MTELHIISPRRLTAALHLFSCAVVAVAAALLIQGCCCGAVASLADCEAKLTYRGKPFSKRVPFKARGLGFTEELAAQAACREYCIAVDPDIEAACQEKYPDCPSGQAKAVHLLDQELMTLVENCSRVCADPDDRPKRVRIKTTCGE